MEYNSLIIILSALILIGLVITIFAIYIKKKENIKPNYKALFIIGICWLPLGIATQNYVFTVIGLVFLILGITHRKAWKQQPKWSELSPTEKKIKLVLIIFLMLILILGIIFYFSAKY